MVFTLVLHVIHSCAAGYLPLCCLIVTFVWFDLSLCCLIFTPAAWYLLLCFLILIPVLINHFIRVQVATNVIYARILICAA